jgi:type IV secretion system protein VirD4
MIRMLASRYRKGDFFAGRMSLFGWLGTLWPSGIEPKGQAVTIGMPGSGKSTAAAIPAVLLHDGPVLVFDPKGELAQRCVDARGKGGQGVRGRGDTTHVVDPVNLTGLSRSRYNPLQEIERETDTNDALRMIFNLAEGIMKNPGGENSWVYTGARDAARGVVCFVLAECPPEQRNLLTVRRLLTEGDREGLAEARKRKLPGVDEMSAFEFLLFRMTEARPHAFRHVIAGEAQALVKMGDRQRGSVLGALKEATAWLDLPQFQDATATCDFYLADFLTEKISLFVCLPLNELNGVAGGFMRLFLVMFTDMMFRKRTKPKAGTVLCLVDEFPAFGHIERFCVIGPQMRDYGVKLWVLLQDLGQLKAVYPKEWEGFIGCAAMVQYMAVHHGETIDYLVKSLGERFVKERQPDGRTMTRPFPLLDREQASRFLSPASGNVIVVRYDQKPLRLKTAPYFWFLPYWRYSPDPRHPEEGLRGWLRRRAVAREEKRRAIGKEGGADAVASA